MTNFKQWIESTEWSMSWPVRPGTGDDPRPQDTPPELTPEGDYILYHGTNVTNFRSINKTRELKHDDLHLVGITTTPSAAGTYAAMKIKRNPSNPSVVVRLVVDKNWLLKQEMSREAGGSGKDQWLLHVDKIPSHAIKGLDVYSVWATPVPKWRKNEI